MLRKLSLRLLLLACGLQLASPLRALDATNAPAPEAKPAASHVTPGPNDRRIAYVVAHNLEWYHYSQHPFDEAYSEKFYDRYLEALDPQHLHFLQSDLAKFSHYRTNLNHLTLTANGYANVDPAYEIFGRFLERLTERTADAEELLKRGKFEFDTDERMLINRHEAPYPKDLDEAKQLWRQRLRFEYLQEELGWTKTENKDGTIPAKAENPGGATEPAKIKTEPVKTMAEEIVDLLTRRYHRILRNYQDWDSEDVMETYLTALANVYDPHSDYLNKRQSEQFAIGMNLSLFGIGAKLNSDLDGYCKIAELIPGGPAFKSKRLKPGDKIVAVAQGEQPPVDIVEMPVDKAVSLIRGPKGTEVRLTVIPADNPSSQLVVNLIRDEIKITDGEAKAKIIDLPTGTGKNVRLGYIDLPLFYAPVDFPGGGGHAAPKSPSADVEWFLKAMMRTNVAGVILDLRRNGGGSLEEAIKLTGLFIKQGPVVQVRRPNGGVEVDEDSNPSTAYEGPLIVLTSRLSASASEIVAAALQDYGRALIVGDMSTHGKGTVQSVMPLQGQVLPATPTATNDPGELKITIRKFYRPSGFSTQLEGVKSDIVLPSLLNVSTDIGESALDNALKPGNPIPKAAYEPMKYVTPSLIELLYKRSTERLATNRDFAYIREDIEQFRKQQGDKTISLNEKQRLAEKEEADARHKAREAERLARNNPAPKTYELALRPVDASGLVEETNSVTAANAGVTSVALAVGANSASVVAKSEPSQAVPPDSSDVDENQRAETARLAETERILADYISLFAEKGALTATSKPGRD